MQGGLAVKSQKTEDTTGGRLGLPTAVAVAVRRVA